MISFRMIAQEAKTRKQPNCHQAEDSSTSVSTWSDSDKLWECRISEVDFSAYSRNVSNDVLFSQATASFDVIRYCFLQVLEGNNSEIGETVSSSDRRTILQDCLCGIMLAGMIECLKKEAFSLLTAQASQIPVDMLIKSLSTFINLAPLGSEHVIKEVLSKVVNVETSSLENRRDILGSFLVSLCEGYGNASWSKHCAFQASIFFIVDSTDQAMLQQLELNLVNSSFLALKSVPRELATKGVEAAMFAIRLCWRLYCPSSVLEENIVIWDGDLNDEDGDAARDVEPTTLPQDYFRPNAEAFKIIIQSIASMQHLVR